MIDLGCGTGIFSIGVAIAGAKEVYGVDIDKNSIKIAKRYANKINKKINFINQDVKDAKINCDTVIMNPPFGAQKSDRKADRKFIEKGFEIASVLYSIHLSKTVPFIEKMVSSMKGKISYSKDYVFPIKYIYEFHKKRVVNYDVTMLRIVTKT